MKTKILCLPDFVARTVRPTSSPLDLLADAAIAAKIYEEERELARERAREKARIDNENKPESALKKPVIEDQLRNFHKNRPRRNCHFQRKQREEEYDYAFDMPSSSKRKRCSESEDGALKSKKPRPKKADIQTGPDLPEEFKNYITAKGGSEVKLVIQKPLFKTDVTKVQNRLSIPLSQIKVNFLTEEEEEYLKSRIDDKHCQEIELQLIDPSLNLRTVCLRKWDMKKSSGNYCSTYVLAKTWYESIVLSNNLKIDNIVQLGSFRVEKELYLALVKVRRGQENRGSGNEDSHGLSEEEDEDGENGRENFEEGESGKQRSEGKKRARSDSLRIT